LEVSWFLDVSWVTGVFTVVKLRSRTPNGRIAGTDLVAAGARVNLWNLEMPCFSDLLRLRYVLRLMGRMSSSAVVSLTAVTVLTALVVLTALTPWALLLLLRLEVQQPIILVQEV
jgi:hypothetical protein